MSKTKSSEQHQADLEQPAQIEKIDEKIPTNSPSSLQSTKKFDDAELYKKIGYTIIPGQGADYHYVVRTKKKTT